jgi:peptidoglycan/xylan/chitin deacetylase (PgdA/CDA1 family)
LAASPDITAQFALARPESTGQSRYAKACGKLSRFLARNVVTKKLTMRNAKPLVTFTFDDAPVSACEAGALLLERYQARGTYYISGGGCGRASPGGWLAAAEQIKALAAKGHEIGCHTYSHTAVSDVGREALAAELERNRSFLQALNGDMTVGNFAYPYGDLSFRVKRLLEAHFDSCRSLLPGVNTGSVDLGALKACELQNASIGHRRILEIIAETVRNNGWLIFVSHDVDDKPSRFGVSPALLEFALTEAGAAGCQLITVQDALRISGARGDRGMLAA